MLFINYYCLKIIETSLLVAAKLKTLIMASNKLITEKEGNGTNSLFIYFTSLDNC